MDILRLPPSLRRSILASSLSNIRQLSTYSPSSATDSTNHPPPPPQQHPQITLSNPSTLTLSCYATSLPPSPSDLHFATRFFTTSTPTPLYTTSTFRTLPPSPFPELAFLGRSNVGKSSLLNALFARSAQTTAYVSKRPGRTRTINGFGVDGGLEWGAAPAKGERGARWKRFPREGSVVVDMPGYGKGSREEWGGEVMKYLRGRRQLRRCFCLVDAEHGLKSSDVELLTHLRRSAVPFSVVLSKVDKLLYSGSRAPGAERLARKTEELWSVCEGIRRRLDAEAGDGREGRVDVICCSAEKSLERNSGGAKRIGIDEVRWAALSACGITSEAGRKGIGDVVVRDEGEEELEERRR